MLLRWTARALDDLNEISFYIEQERSVSAADKVCSTIFESVQMLANHPRLGKPGRLAGTRELIVSKYVVGYRVGADSVEIIRIRHGARRPTP
jgi:toxin ParE1/3/4